MISTTAEYALRAAVYLAKRNAHTSGRAEIAEATLVPREYLVKVLKALENAGIVVSKRGPGGGYALGNLAHEITVLDVVLAVDDIPRIKRCPLGIAGHKQLCPLHRLLDVAAAGIEEAFGEVTLQDLTNSERHAGLCSFPRKSH
jgi:Rrf2 family protein